MSLRQRMQDAAVVDRLQQVSQGSCCTCIGIWPVTRMLEAYLSWYCLWNGAAV